MSDTLQLAKELIDINSVTPNDNGCQKILIDRLKKMNFHITELNSNGVSNFFAVRGNGDTLFAFAGHTDIVPPGDESEWTSPPFQATIRDEKLFGRGAADMKSALAAMIVATENFIAKHPGYSGKIGFLITSDEEGTTNKDGTIKIVEYLEKNNIKINYCLVGEASSNKILGDSIKVGRRGSLHGDLTVHGKQGHIAYPHLAINPIHRSFQALDFLTKMEWDKGNELFSPTSFQIYNIHADTGATNVIPGSLSARFNFRHSPESDFESIKARVEKTLSDHQLDFSINWNHASKPFYSKPGALTKACADTIKNCCNMITVPNTTGGTSDGRFIAPTGAEVVELGLCSGSIHHVNEHTSLHDLEKLTELYENILSHLLS